MRRPAVPPLEGGGGAPRGPRPGPAARGVVGPVRRHRAAPHARRAAGPDVARRPPRAAGVADGPGVHTSRTASLVSQHRAMTPTPVPPVGPGEPTAPIPLTDAGTATARLAATR